MALLLCRLACFSSKWQSRSSWVMSFKDLLITRSVHTAGVASHHETNAPPHLTSLLPSAREGTTRYAATILYESLVSPHTSLTVRAYGRVPPIPDQPLPGFKDIPELLARFGRPRSVSVGPQSEIDVWEQIDYR